VKAGMTPSRSMTPAAPAGGATVAAATDVDAALGASLEDVPPSSHPTNVIAVSSSARENRTTRITSPPPPSSGRATVSSKSSAQPVPQCTW
jgi:hypothetical protein